MLDRRLGANLKVRKIRKVIAGRMWVYNTFTEMYMYELQYERLGPRTSVKHYC